MQITTLHDLGPTVPIPYKDSCPEFSFKPWRMAEEKAVGQLKKKNKHLGKFVREVFDLMLDKFNGNTWADVPANDRKLYLNQMPMGSIFYMYMYLRYDALGDEIKIQRIKCPSCGTEIKEFVGDLNSLEVKTQTIEDPKTVDYELKRPFTLGEVEIKAIRLSYTPWDCMEKINTEMAGNAALLRESMLLSSFHGVVAEPGGYLETLDRAKILSMLTKRDIEGVYNALDAHNGGPVLGLSMSCTACDFEWDAPLDWSWDYFFSNSSQ